MKKKKNIYKFCVAPMFRYTDEHCRKIYRIMSKKTLLFTEMIHVRNILYDYKNKIILNKKKENPIAIQIAGSNSLETAKCAEIIYKKKYKYINLNIGCPSIKAQKGNFGIILMKKPKTIINLINSIKDNTPMEVSIKTRIGIDKNDNYNFLSDFINDIYINSNCKIFILHARSAILNNFSTKKNLKIPKINYKIVYKIKKQFPKLKIILNGEIKSIKESLIHLKKVDGVMLGRNIYKNPMMLNYVDKNIYNIKNKYSFKKKLKKIFKYINKKVKENIQMYKITRHILEIFKGNKGSTIWKKLILENAKKKINIEKIFKIYKKNN
ncbi:tRNA dihydrouridine(20/20a) synthase DusA [Buchnera aphidicola (Ceratoglyphina bambusae)]|uniref:tRNA dihydrouridine(20/20a) synthase DusA n=1 Tax=Buchnera aphidicola TaxID=9 RepID=UPI0031B835A4